MTAYFDVTEKTMNKILSDARYREHKIPVLATPMKVEILMPPATGKNKDIVRAKVEFGLPKEVLNMEKSNRLFSMGLNGLFFLPEETVTEKMKVNTKRLREQPDPENSTVKLINFDISRIELLLGIKTEAVTLDEKLAFIKQYEEEAAVARDKLFAEAYEELEKE